MNSLLKGQSSGGFLGVNLRQDRLSIADQEVAKAINSDFHTQPGVIVLRLGRTAENSTALTDLAVRRIIKVNDHRFRVAGRSLYCYDAGYITIINGTLSANLITTMLPFRPLNDSTVWNFVADDDGMYKVLTTNCALGTWGIPATPAPLTISAGTGTFTGDYTAAFTFVRLSNGAVAAEGSPNSSGVAGAVTLSSRYLAIYYMTHPSDTTTNALGIYRSVAGSTIPQLDQYLLIPSEPTYSITHGWEVGEVTGGTTSLQFDWPTEASNTSVSGPSSGNPWGSQDWENGIGSGSSEDAAGRRATGRWEITDGYVTTQTKHWAFCSTVADLSLGALYETDNGVPPNCSWAVNFQEHAFLCRDADNPHYLWFSKRFKPEAVPADNFLEIGNPDDPLQCALAVGGMLGVLARKTKYRVMGNVTTGFFAQEAASPRGTPCPMAAITTERGITFVARDGIFNTFLASPDENFAGKILPLFFGETVNDMGPINWDQATKFSAAYYKNRYYFSYAESQHSSPNRVAVYSFDTGNWYHYDHPLNALSVEEDTDILFGGGLDGFVYLLESGVTDGGSDVAMDVETKDYQGEEGRNVRKLFQYLKLNTNTGGAEVTVEVYVDDSLVRSTTVTTTTRRETLVPLPAGIMGHTWRVRFRYTGSTRVRIYSCAAFYLPLAVV